MMIDVLIVDDSATIRTLIKKALTLSCPFLGDVHEAEDGIAALAFLADHKVDLMLMDVNMPRLGGMELVKRMKNDPALADLPVIVVSTEGSKERIEELREQGVVGYLRKPFRPEQLKETIYEVMELSDDGSSEESGGYDF